MINYRIVKNVNPGSRKAVYYAHPVNCGYVDFNDLADNISKECTLTRHDLLAAFSALEEQVVKALADGKPVRLGSLGSFRVTFKCHVADSPDDFTNANIQRVKVTFAKGARIRKALRVGSPLVSLHKIGQTDDDVPV